MKDKDPKCARPQSDHCTHESCTQELGAVSSQSPSFFPEMKTPWEEFHRFQTERLSRILAQRGVAPDHVQVVLQEVWLEAVKHHRRFQGEDVDKRLACWLNTVARSKASDLRRRNKRQRAESLDNLSAELVDSATREAAELVEGKERDDCLQARFEELRKKDPLNCWLVWERVVNRRSIRDLAAETGLGSHSITCRIGRTFKKLRGRLSEFGPARNASMKLAAKKRGRKKQI